jgi:hypothetical protein
MRRESAPLMRPCRGREVASGTPHWRRDFANRSERLDVPRCQMFAHRMRALANSTLLGFVESSPAQVLELICQLSG